MANITPDKNKRKIALCFFYKKKGADYDHRISYFPRLHYPRCYLSAVHHSVRLLRDPSLNLHFQTQQTNIPPSFTRNWTGIFILSTLCGSHIVCNNCIPGVCRTLAVRPCPARPGSCNSCNIRVRRGLLPHTFPCFCSSKYASSNTAFCRVDFCGKPF